MFGSYFFSILLHLALALLIFLWPSSPPVKLDQPMMQISVNMGAPGGNRMASPVLGPQGKPMPTKAAPQPAPAEQAASAVPVAREDTAQPKAEPKKESQPKPKPTPEPKPDEVALAQKKEPKKPKDEEEEESKEKPKEKPKDDGKVLSCTVARSSGRAEVDASAVNAVIRTKVLPAPPTPDQQELLLTFNTQEMMGRR